MISAYLMIVIAYLFGSLSSAIVVCKIMKLPDPRSKGSKNPGTTNVLRIGGKIPALITLIGDVLKGILPVLIATIFGITGIALGFVAFAACLGHVFPLFFKFRGGKAVATAFGAIFALSPLVCLLTLATWLIVVAISRYVSLASLISFIAAPIYTLFLSDKYYFIPLLAIAILIFWRHKENIQRLAIGKENKLKLISH